MCGLSEDNNLLVFKWRSIIHGVSNCALFGQAETRLKFLEGIICTQSFDIKSPFWVMP